MNSKEIEKKVLEICEVEGLFKEKMKPHPKFEFAFKIVYPSWHPRPKNLIVLVPFEKRYVSIDLATKISPKHLEAFTKMKEQGMDFLPLFFHMLRNLLLNKNLFYNFNIKQQSYIISEHIYFDGLTMENFYRRLRGVYYAALSAQNMINEIASGKFKGLQMSPSKLGSPDDGPGSSSEDLFYS